MNWTEEAILSILDRCCDAFTFPMLDNGYVYLAASRMSAFRSADDWALAIEVFGYSPRAGIPDLHVYTFASRLGERDTPEQYASPQTYENYLANNPNNQSRFFFPIDEGSWQDPDDGEYVADGARELLLRGRPFSIPEPESYPAHGIELEEFPRVLVFELCRYLAAVARDDVLATDRERRASVPPELDQVLTLEDWNHPDVVDATKRPSGSETFRQLARVLVTGDPTHYRPTLPGNTHWRNWPEGGTL
jgi:hypothetical protein